MAQVVERVARSVREDIFANAVRVQVEKGDKSVAVDAAQTSSDPLEGCSLWKKYCVSVEKLPVEVEPYKFRI